MLCCSECESGERSNPNHAGSCDDLDFTEVSLERTSELWLRYFCSCRHDSRRWVQAPGYRRVRYCFVLFLKGV